MINDEVIKILAEKNSLITPFDMELLQPHSYDCTLGDSIWLARNTMGQPDWVARTVGPQGFDLSSLSFALGTTREYLKLPHNVVGFVQGKSTVGRNGLQIECAGLIDAGFEGAITLELFNMVPWIVNLQQGMPICQIHFTYVDTPLHKDYKKIGHYNGQRKATLPVYSLGDQ